ncbi:BTB/POZ protein [Xylariaceae sp. FL0255]|nr:BTB/POZ protein [Xylariaceae sp. FL0255]
MIEPRVIRLQVGGRQFVTTEATLVRESRYFSGMLSRYTNEDKVYFIDSDPDLFVDILRYLRFGNLPLFFDQSTKTFDYAKYAALLSEARFFGIDKLETWIQRQGYLEAIHVKYTISEVILRKDLRCYFPRGNLGDIACGFLETNEHKSFSTSVEGPSSSSSKDEHKGKLPKHAFKHTAQVIFHPEVCSGTEPQRAESVGCTDDEEEW